MIQNARTLEIRVNGGYLDLGDDTTLSINLNKKFFNPESPLVSSNGEYSYSFTIPATPHNISVFSFANILSRKNKFSRKQKCDVFADGDIIFEGELTINDATTDSFTCNLVIIKNKSISDVFEDTKLASIDWKIEFEGGTTINEINADANSKVFFPLACYGAMMKNPRTQTEQYSYYSSLHDIDSTNQWYINTFMPSFNLIELIKKCFEYKNIKLSGNAIDNEYLSKIYCSTYLASEQDPQYNLGFSKFGKTEINVEFNNWDSSGEIKYSSEFLKQDLTYPYFPTYTFMTPPSSDMNQDKHIAWNFESIGVRNILNNNYFASHTISTSGESYMYQKEENQIVVPESGWYKVKMDSTLSVVPYGTYNGSPVYTKWTYEYTCYGDEPNRELCFHTNELNEQSWSEIQLVRNYDNDIEMIKGMPNKLYKYGVSFELVQGYEPEAYLWYSAYPHEMQYGSYPSTNVLKDTHIVYGTNKNADYSSNTRVLSDYFSGIVNGDYTSIAAIAPLTGTPTAYQNVFPLKESGLGYMPQSTNDVFRYDPVINPNFICGLSSFGRCASIIKNGYGYYEGNTTNNEIIATSRGYHNVFNPDDGGKTVTDVNKDTLPDSPSNYCTVSDDGKSLSGSVSALVWLEKGDILTPMLVNRAHQLTDEGWETPALSGTCHIVIEAFGQGSRESYKEKGVGWNDTPEFDSKLNLANFLNNEETMSDFIQNFINEFGIDGYFTSDGEFVMDLQKDSGDGIKSCVNLDDRINSYDVKISRIEYPKSIAVQYDIDTDEYGFEISVPSNKINLPTWKEYGDKGYDKIIFNTDTGAAVSQSLKTSYCWWDDKFRYKIDGNNKTLNLPVITKSEYFIDGGNYEDMLQHDGKSLKRRYWFRNFESEKDKDGNPIQIKLTNLSDRITLYTPKEEHYPFELSYKDNDTSILHYFFNISKNRTSNFIEINCYITADEYNKFKNGWNVILDDDIYQVVEVTGYNPKGDTQATLVLMKL